jgi:hypothetical protein
MKPDSKDKNAKFRLEMKEVTGETDRPMYNRASPAAENKLPKT